MQTSTAATITIATALLTGCTTLTPGPGPVPQPGPSLPVTGPIRLYQQMDIYGRPVRKAQKMAGKIAASRWYNGPMGILDLDKYAGWKPRPYMTAAIDTEGLTDHGRETVKAISVYPYGLIMFCDWCYEHDRGAHTPSLRADVKGASLYTDANREKFRGILRDVAAYCKSIDRPPRYVQLSIESTSRHAVQFYLDLGATARAVFPDSIIAVNFLGEAQSVAKQTPGYGADGIQFFNSHDTQGQGLNDDGKQHHGDEGTYTRHMDSVPAGKHHLGWSPNQGDNQAGWEWKK